ncbi:glutathione S-transferase T3-like protein [Tanacetum coccineum]
MPSTPNHETSQHVSRNLFEDSQIPSRSTEKISKWETKEDIALMAAWCQVSGDPTRGNNQRKNENEQVGAATGITYSRMKSGMSMKDVELDAHKIYEGDGSKFLDLTVFNEVMCKHPKWMLNIDRDNTRSRPIDEEPNEESGGSTKRSRTSEEGEYVVHSNQETPNSGGSTIQRPIGRDAAKKKGKGKASQSFSSAEFVEELAE